MPLRWATRGKNWYSRQEPRLQPPRSKRGTLYIELRERSFFEKWRKPEVTLPIPQCRTLCFRDSPGALVRFSFQKNESPRCRPVLSGLRVRCIAGNACDSDMEAHPGLAPGNSVLQTDGSTTLPYAPQKIGEINGGRTRTAAFTKPNAPVTT